MCYLLYVCACATMFTVGMDGQVSVLCAPDGPCYRCLHPSPPLATRSCAEAGVLGPVPGLIGCLQAMEVIKILVSRSTHPSSSTSSNDPNSTQYTTAASQSSSQQQQLQPLINRQCYYDGARGEFHTFILPGRNPKCVSCCDDPSVVTIRNMTDSENNIASMLSYIQTCSSQSTTPLPILHSDNTISITSFYKTLSEVASVDSVSILLDVRSDIQYNIGSFEYYRKQPYTHTTNTHTTNTTSSSQSSLVYTHMNTMLKTYTNNNSLVLRHIPYSTLINYTTHNDIYNNILDSTNGDNNNTNRSIIVYVICRRGNDSIRAAKILLSIIGHNSDRDRKLKMVNVEGGVTAWQREIDSSFPII